MNILSLSEHWRKLLLLLARRQSDRELDTEVQRHTKMATPQSLDAAVGAENGRRAALQTFGNSTLQGMKNRKIREVREWHWLDDLVRDARYAVRSLRRSPAFAAVVVLTVALGVGATTAMFSVLYSTCLAPLPYAEPNRLVDISMAQASGRRLNAGTSLPNLRDWIAEASSFEGLAAHRLQYYANLTGHGEAEEIHAWRLSAQAMPLLRVRPLLGRWFEPHEDMAGGPRSAVLSHELWQRRFHSESTVLGTRVFVDGEALTIVGVMPERFEFPPLFGSSKPVMWLSLNLPVEIAADRNTHSLHVFGRLKPGISIEQAQAEMNGISGRLAKAYPKENSEWSAAKVVPLSEASFVNEFRSALWLLSAAAGLVLLIACANVASLLIARGATREREFAVRRALGVSTSRLVRQVLTESCVIAGAGCVFGVLFAYWSLPILKSMLEGQPRVDEIAIQPVVLAFALVVSLLTGILFGILPALRVGWRGTAGVQAGRVGPSRQRLRKALVTLEIALSLVLLSAAGLLMESLWRASRVDLGFRPDQVLSMRFNLPQGKYDSGHRVEAFRVELLRRVTALPGVAFAGTNSAPPMGAMSQSTGFDIEGTPPMGVQERNSAFSNVSPDYLHAMGIPLLRGRDFQRTDRPGSFPVVLVSQLVARRFFGGEEILGKRIRFSRLESAEWFTVIGVVGDVRESHPENLPSGTLYALSSQLPVIEQGGRAAHLIVLVLRTTHDASGIANAVKTAVADIDKDQAVGDVLTMRQLVNKRLAGRRLDTLLIGLFAALAVTLAIVGVFGIVSYSVSCRKKEISIRMALGARQSTVLAMFMHDTLSFGIGGVLAGFLASLGTSRLLATRLYSVAPTEPYILFASAALLAAAAIVATIFAARRLIGLDAIAALRHE